MLLHSEGRNIKKSMAQNRQQILKDKAEQARDLEKFKKTMERINSRWNNNYSNPNQISRKIRNITNQSVVSDVPPSCDFTENIATTEIIILPFKDLNFLYFRSQKIVTIPWIKPYFCQEFKIET